LGSAAIAANYTAAAAAGLTKEFAAWTKEFLGEDDPANLKKTTYMVSQGKSLPPAKEQKMQMMILFLKKILFLECIR